MRFWIKTERLVVLLCLVLASLIWIWWHVDRFKDIEIDFKEWVLPKFLDVSEHHEVGMELKEAEIAERRSDSNELVLPKILDVSKHHVVGIELKEAEIAEQSHDFTSKMSEIKRFRKQHLAQQCLKKDFSNEKHSSEVIHPDVIRLVDDYHSRASSKPIMPRLYVSEKYKLVFCAIDGVEDEVFAKYITKLEGKEVSSPEPRQLWNYRKESIVYRLQTFYKVVFVRNPLSRVIAIYNKYKLLFENTSSQSSQGESEFSKIYLQYFKTLEEKEPQFRDFLAYLKRQKFELNTYAKLCMPCAIEYDFVGKMETFEDDFEFVRAQIKDENGKSPQFESVSVKDVYERFTWELLDSLYDLTSNDFTLFGYSYP